MIYDMKLNRKMVQSKFAVGVLAKGSKSKGASMDLEKSAKDIPGFVKQHNLDTSTLYKKVEEFRTFNDFFARGMKVDECRPMADPEDESVVVSPADCRMTCWVPTPRSISRNTKAVPLPLLDWHRRTITDGI